MTYEEAEHLLDTYELTEILSMNDLTEADALIFMIDEEFLIPPKIQPL